MTDPETRPSLIIRLADHRDQVAWRAFLETYEPFLMHLARRQGVPKGHVNDVTQQILLAVAKSVESFSDDGSDASFRRWISRVARNTVIKYMVGLRRQPAGPGGTDALLRLDNLPGRDDPALQRQYDHELVVWAAMSIREEFSESSWQAFWLTMIEGDDVDRVCQELNLSRGAIYMARSRVLKRIREKLTKVMQ